LIYLFFWIFLAEKNFIFVEKEIASRIRIY
jgi:hypothetical protein